MEISLVVLVTGLVVVFSMLIILIGVIKLYGSVIYFFENKMSKKKDEKSGTVKNAAVAKNAQNNTVSNEVTAEIVAAITAAVVYLEGTDMQICQIKKAGSNANVRSAWGFAGQLELTKPF